MYVVYWDCPKAHFIQRDFRCNLRFGPDAGIICPFMIKTLRKCSQSEVSESKNVIPYPPTQSRFGDSEFHPQSSQRSMDFNVRNLSSSSDK